MTSSAWIACAGRSRWPGRGRAPSFHARALASATAPRKRSRHCSSTRSITRNAVESDGTPPNRSAWSRSAPRSARHSPPSESITARSRSTTPGSCAERRSRVAAIASESARVSPTRSATPASSALPAWATWPVPSALTCSLSTSPSRCTIRVILPGSRYECQEPAFSPPRRPLMQDRGLHSETMFVKPAGGVTFTLIPQGSSTNNQGIPSCHSWRRLSRNADWVAARRTGCSEGLLPLRCRGDRDDDVPCPITKAAEPPHRSVDRQDHYPVYLVLACHELIDAMELARRQDLGPRRHRVASQPTAGGARRDHHAGVAADALRLERLGVGQDKQLPVLNHEPHRRRHAGAVALEAGQADVLAAKPRAEIKAHRPLDLPPN